MTNAMLLLFLGIPLSIWWAYVAKTLWWWFVVPTLHLPPIGMVQALGLALIVGLLRTHDYDKDDDAEKGIRNMVIGALVVTFQLGHLAFVVQGQ